MVHGPHRTSRLLVDAVHTTRYNGRDAATGAGAGLHERD